ncbi:Aldo/keto reductase [Exidia glandulosa HHB12029]|uniref:Aldo/keto reductase n=1 Tax=Exidia glandulosa HHB12029 TaxID=1314781 RepID=A0A165DMN3_EXIGL|nr:Aldo/keto reductase [Exidia glandulosa HHB12029]
MLRHASVHLYIPTMTVPTRTFGKNGPQVSVVGLGLMGMSAYYGPAMPDETAFPLLDKAIELGCTHWDTRCAYNTLNRYFKARPGAREKVFLATKFGVLWDGKTMSARGDYDYVIECGNKALERIGTSYIDLFYVHRIDEKTPIEITMRALVQLKKEGKIRHIGLSECGAATLRRACAVHPVAALEVEYSPFALDIEHEDINLLAVCRELGIAIVAYSPLGRGILTGRYRSVDDFADDDYRKNGDPRYSPENFHRNLEVVDKFGEIAKTHGVTAGQLALAWLLAQGDDIFPIPGTTKIANMEENIAATKVKLSGKELEELNKVVRSADVRGDRYSVMAAVILDTVPLQE